MVDWSELREWATAAIAALVFGLALYEYRNAQRWKRAEWVAAEMKQFFQDPYIRNASMLLHALSSDSSPQVRDYTDPELSIRDSFDHLLDALERIESFVRAGLVSHEELVPYLGYWVDVMENPRNAKKLPEVRARILAYMHDYGFGGAKRLLQGIAGQTRAASELQSGADMATKVANARNPA